MSFKIFAVMHKFQDFCRKGDHDGAIVQYIKTIGKLEASYIIRKVGGFLYLVFVNHQRRA